MIQDLTIVIITWNEKDFIVPCLESIYRNISYLSFNVILVDNGSQDGKTDIAKDRFPDINLIKNDKNMGVAFARNQGMAKAVGRYILLLDTDTLALPGALEEMVKFMDRHEDIGILGPKLTDANGNLQFSCRRYHTALTSLLRRLSFLSFIAASPILKKYYMQDWNHQEPRDVEHIIGACQLIRVKAQVEVGSLDNRMFYGWEDTDYCVRMHRAGYKVFYYPYVSIIHFEKKLSHGKIFSKLLFENIKSMLLFFIKYPTGIIGKY